MGVYIFQSKHAHWIKVGHHKITASRPNVYYRVARRGFHSCVHPPELEDYLDEEHFVLIRWYPQLGRRDETAAHKSCKEKAYGEFHPLCDLNYVIECLDKRGTHRAVDEKEHLEALSWPKKYDLTACDSNKSSDWSLNFRPPYTTRTHTHHDSSLKREFRCKPTYAP